MTGIIETDRLILRTPKPSDVERIAAIADNWRIASMLGLMPHPFTQRDAMDFIVRVASLPADAAQFAITLNDEDGLLIGGAGYGPAHRLPEGYGEETDFGYWLGEAFWGHGIASQAVPVVVAHAFREFDLVRIFAYAFEGNTASERVLEKAGFACEGVLRQSVFKQGRMLDQKLYALLRQEWQQQNPATR